MGRQAYDAVLKDMLQRAKIERRTPTVREGG